MADLDVRDVPTWYLEDTINDTLPGLQNFVRDVWLTPSQLARYEVDAILRSPHPVEATSRVGGMRTAHRFAILSNHMAPVPASPDELCLHASAPGSRFQVVDVFTHGSKTQVTLLHLPDDERWRLLAGVRLSLVQERIPEIRKRFSAKCEASPIPEVSTDDWLTRMHDPVGLDAHGRPYPVEIPLAERLRPLAETSFRDVANKLLYVRGATSALRPEEAFPGIATYPDCICWGYVDHERGLCLDALCDARLDETGTIVRGHALDDVLVRLELGSVKGLEGADLCDPIISEFSERIEPVRERHAEDDERYRDLRALGMLDPFRSSEWPDDVQAILAGEGLSPELVWLRLEHMDEDEDGIAIYARLLNEPEQDYPVHAGDLLPLVVLDSEDGPVCLAIPERVG